MRRMFSMLMSLLAASGWAWAQDEEILRTARYLSGATSEEQVDEYWIERLEARVGRRIRINERTVRADGLLSDYQLASLADYRAHCGDILSWEELALVDGFSREAVEALRPFLSLASSRLPGQTDTTRIRVHTLVRGTLSSIGGKARAQGEYWRAGGAWRGSDGTFYAEGTWRGHRLLLGHFNLRLGQGLTYWSGFSMSSLSTIDAFIRRTPGASPVWSYSSSSVYLGGVYEYTSTHWRGLAFGSISGNFGAHADWLGRNGQAGLTVGWNGQLCVSADTRWNWRGADLCAEIAWKNGSVGALAAFRKPIGPLKLALQGRVIPSRFSGKKNGEYALATGLSFQSEQWKSLAGKTGFGNSVPEHKASLTLDASLLPIPSTGTPNRLQVRAHALWQWQFASAWSLELRLTERYRNYEHPRTDLRADLRFANGPWLATTRLEGVHCQEFGFLNYWEGGYKKEEHFAVYLRLTGFLIDAWDDRIYCYERDAPGSFSVPAFSGRGGMVSLTGSWKHHFKRITLKAYLRGSWMVRKDRTPTPGLNLQLHCDW